MANFYSDINEFLCSGFKKCGFFEIQSFNKATYCFFVKVGSALGVSAGIAFPTK
jgi:hypothetical protein